MEEIESFVRKLCAEGDLRILTKKLIRTQYQAHYKKATVSREEKDKINEVLETVIEELADQTKDPLASTDGEQFVNSASLDQGKENLRTDYVGLADAESPAVGVPHKVGYRTARADLGGTNFSHNHLIQVSLNGNAISDKTSTVRFRSSSAGTNEVPPQRRSSPRKRTSSDSVSSSRTVEAVPVNCDSVSDGKSVGQSGNGVERLGVAGDSEAASKIKRQRGGRSEDTYSNCSSDEVALLPLDSDSSEASRKRKVNSPPKWRKARMERMKALDTSDMSAGDGRNSCKPSTKQRQHDKTRRMYSVQSVLSAILESDSSSDCVQNGDDLPLSSPDKASGRPQPSDSRPLKGVSGSKTRHSRNGEKRSQTQSPHDHSAIHVQRKSPHHWNRSKRTRPAYIKSGDLPDGVSVNNDPSDQSPQSKKAKQHVNGSVSVPASSSESLLHSGFSADRFFAKKVKPVPKSKARKPRRPRIDSDSDLSCSSMPSPVKGRRGEMVPSQKAPAQNCVDSDSDTSLSKRIEESPGKVKAKKSVSSDSKSVNGGTKTAERMKIPEAENTVPAGQNFQPAAVTTKMKVTAKARKWTLKNKGKKQRLSSDGSDTDDLPLSLLQQREKQAESDSIAIVTDSETSGNCSGLQPSDEPKEEIQTVKNKMRTGGTFPTSIKNSKGSPFSPPVSPVVRKAIKRGRRTGQSVVGRSTKTISPQKNLVFSEDSVNDSSCDKESGGKSVSSGPKSSGNISTKKDVYSLSDSSEEKLIPGQILEIDEQNVDQKTGSAYSLSESTEEETGNCQHQRPLTMKKKASIKKGTERARNACKGEALTDMAEPVRTSETETVVKEPGKDAGVGEWRTSEESGADCDMPWSAVAYRGESLMFPIIQLRDILQGMPASSGNGGAEAVSSKRERNIFEVLESSTRAHDDTKDAHGKPPKVRINLSEIIQEQHCASAVVQDQTTHKPEPASLDESRTVLKKQRTVKKITPHLRTTLKLRKQVSPDVASEVEEWAVVSQEESDASAGGGRRLGDGDRGVETPSPRPKRRGWNKAKKRKAAAMVVSSDDEDDKPLVVSVKDSQDSLSESDKDDEDTPVKAKKPKRKKLKVQLDSSEEDDLLLRTKSDSVDTEDVKQESEAEDVKLVSEEDDDEEQPLSVKKSKKRKKKQLVESSDDDDEPLKPRPASPDENVEECQNNHDGTLESEEDLTPVKIKKSKKRKRKQPEESSEDDEPLKPRRASGDMDGEKCQDNCDGMQQSEEDLTPLKIKTSLKAPKLIFTSSDDGLSPMKVRLKPSQESENDLDTSSLSSCGDDEARPEPAKSKGPRIKFTMKKVQPTEKAKSKNAKEKGSKKVKTSVAETDEAPYLKRLRLICRKVGIFVRNDVHFAGCTSDKQKIERLKEALRKAGMKGQPSLSKVDSVNLKREAEALDTANIIDTSGRPKRKPKDMFGPASPKKSLSPIKQQFSRIQDLISDSESD